MTSAARRLLSEIGWCPVGLLLILGFCIFAWLVLKLQVQVWDWLGLT